MIEHEPWDDFCIDEAMLHDDISAPDRSRVRYWKCPIHWTYVKAPGNPAITVEWRGGVAYCLHAGCTEDSSAALPLDDARPLGLIKQFIFERINFLEMNRCYDNIGRHVDPCEPRCTNVRADRWRDLRG